MTPLLQDQLTDKLQVGKADGIGWLVFNQPDRHNALTLAMWEGIPTAMDALAADPEVRVIVVRGAGTRAFASGADISEFEQVRATPAQVEAYDAAGDRAGAAIAACPTPTVAMIHGYCMGGAVALALSCDLRFASETARFGIPAAKLGVGYDFVGLRKLVSLVGPAHAREIFYTARQFSGAEALQMGWVNRLVPEAELDETVLAQAATIAANAPLTVQAVKTIVGELGKDPARRDLARCEQVVADCFASADYVEGRRAFMEKRRPVFRGV